MHTVFEILFTKHDTKIYFIINQTGDIVWFQIIIVDNSTPVSETDNYITNINPIYLDSPETVFVLFLIRYNGKSAEYVKLIHKV